jgi:hypothetical protein
MTEKEELTIARAIALVEQLRDLAMLEQHTVPSWPKKPSKTF